MGKEMKKTFAPMKRKTYNNSNPFDSDDVHILNTRNFNPNIPPLNDNNVNARTLKKFIRP